ncbi:MAG TPA: hypothetical protein VFV17_06455, partial [Usitatibacteraceae bacterium]|nr:hypothetical protein [Usitatibacteraceae bacterium]
ALAESVAADIDQPFIDWRELAGADAPRNVLLAEILAQLVADLDRFQAQGFAAFTERWAALSALQGREVLVHMGAERLAATVVGVAADGALQVHCAGTLRTIASGEVSVRVAPDRRAP